MLKLFGHTLTELGTHVLCARVVYAGLAVTYTAAVLGIDKGICEVLISVLYVALTVVKH